MVTKYVIDTHALIWFIQGDPRIGPRARAVLANPASCLVLPAIVLAEAVWIVEKGRTAISSPQSLLQTVRRDRRIKIHSLDRPIISKTMTMQSIDEMHDRQIVATALQLLARGENASVLTQDAKITQSGLVPTLW